MKLSAKMKRALDFMGKPYEVKEIDWELCLYRDLLNGYDLEVSGINHPGRGNICNYIAVWDISHGKNYTARTVEYVRDIKTLQDLKNSLEDLSEKYSGKQLERAE